MEEETAQLAFVWPFLEVPESGPGWPCGWSQPTLPGCGRTSLLSGVLGHQTEWPRLASSLVSLAVVSFSTPPGKSWG